MEDHLSPNEEVLFANILKSMGIDQYDPSALQAIIEYARRIAADLICDSKDFANHTDHNDVMVDDAALAIKLSESLKFRIDDRRDTLQSCQDYINKKSLTEQLVKAPPSLHRYQDTYLNRSFTYVPGDEAYIPEDVEANSPSSGNASRLGDHSSHQGQHKSGSSSGASALSSKPNLLARRPVEKFQPVALTRERTALKPTAGFSPED